MTARKGLLILRGTSGDGWDSKLGARRKGVFLRWGVPLGDAVGVTCSLLVRRGVLGEGVTDVSLGLVRRGVFTGDALTCSLLVRRGVLGEACVTCPLFVRRGVLGTWSLLDGDARGMPLD